jgi:hypothetical protein
MNDLIAKLLRWLTSRSPRLVCESCGAGFLLGSIQVRFSGARMQDCCPRCGAPGPFRAPSAEEAAAIQPEGWHWWIIAPAALAILAAIGAGLWTTLR